LLLLVYLEFALHNLLVLCLHEETTLGQELLGADLRENLFYRRAYQTTFRNFLVLDQQIAQQQLKSVGKALLVHSQAHNWEEFDPLDEHLGHGLFAVLQEYVGVHLVEVNGGDSR